MLSPSQRLSYLEELRPPLGFTLDKAVATTFSLDLVALLTAPLSMALFEAESVQEALRDQVAILEALRRTSDRITVFCQEGRIATPARQHPLFSFLEQIVVEVAPEGTGVFHPKTWLLRFTNRTDDVFYRFLCLSRNLTFDRSWDTVLRLEGRLRGGIKKRQNAYQYCHPLGDFFQALPALARNASRKTILELEKMQAEIRRVDWEKPEGVEEISFHPMGIAEYPYGPNLEGYSRVLMVSPFVEREALAPLLEGPQNILISRPEALDALSEKFRTRLADTTSAYCMHQQAEEPTDLEGGGDERSENEVRMELSGLHAKLYLLEHGWNSTILMGSANATNAAWRGKNVELLVGLTGKKSRFGIHAFLGDEQNPNGFSQLLQPYDLCGEPVLGDAIVKELEKQLESAQRTLAAMELHAEITPAKDGRFQLTLQRKGRAVAHDAFTNLLVKCRPLLVGSEFALSASPLFRKEGISFSLAVASLSTFMVFELEAELDGKKRGLSFVRNIPTKGMPEERSQHILRTIISNKDQFLRHLLLLLAEEPEESLMEVGLGDSRMAAEKENVLHSSDFPLFEKLVRAFSRNPETLREVASVIAQQEEAGNSDVLPEGLAELWTAFTKAAKG